MLRYWVFRICKFIEKTFVAGISSCICNVQKDNYTTQSDKCRTVNIQKMYRSSILLVQSCPSLEWSGFQVMTEQIFQLLKGIKIRKNSVDFTWFCMLEWLAFAIRSMYLFGFRSWYPLINRTEDSLIFKWFWYLCVQYYLDVHCM
jgi:hypothetical protein